MQKRIEAIILILLFVTVLGNGQARNDQFSYQDFINNVINHHPISKQARLLSQFADAEMRGARGMFDPKLNSNWDDKYFDEKHYFRIFESEVKVPTQFGLSVKAGYENTEGVFLNPENTTDPLGLWSVGIEANLLQGLLIDERRTAVRQAELMREMNEAERQKQMNALVEMATAAYIDWQLGFRLQNIIQQSIELAEVYFQATRESFLNGDKPAIDTLEAFLIVQDRLALRQENLIFQAKTQQNLENFLWLNDQAQTLQNGIQPEILPTTSFELLNGGQMDFLIQNHPEIAEKIIKRSSLQVDRRLFRDKLKPQLTVQYNPLLATSEESLRPSFSIANYKWGFTLKSSLFFRKERAKIDKTDLKIQDLNLDLENKVNSLQNKIEANLQQQNLLNDQVVLNGQNVDNYERLLEAERIRFNLGESSVFLLNKRQEKFVEGQIKQAQIEAKLIMEKVKFLYLTNQFDTYFNN